MKKIKKYFLTLVLPFVFFSCKAANSPVGGQTNNPVINNQTNFINFTIAANSFNYNHVERLNFGFQGYALNLTVNGYVLGFGTIYVKDSSGGILRVDSLDSNSTLNVTQQFSRIPYELEIDLTGYTGNIAYTLTSSQNNQEFDLSNFPDTVGDYWNYSVFDSLSFHIYNVNVSITQQVPQLVGTTNEWVTAGGPFGDTSYAYTSSDEIDFYNNNDFTYPSSTFIFPLEPGLGWGTSIDTSYVLGIETVSVPAGNFDNAYHIVRNAYSFNYILNVDYWIVPNVGIVKKHKYERDLSVIEASNWQLESYNVTQ
jgi:hypothetical protein